MSTYTAIIIEPRRHKALPFVLNNFLNNLSDEWNIIIFHGNCNIDYVKNSVNNLEKKDRINLVNLNINNLNHITYSNLFLSTGFYNYIPTETFLVFQTDSMILEKNKALINDFLKYDYVGAPWKDGSVGNGGLSLRKKSKMLEILNSKWPRNGNEDIYFSYNIDKNIIYNLPDYNTAKMFSVETVFYESPFGIHNCWNHLKKEDTTFLINTYSEIQDLINLQ
jgi:hypothetical protein